MDRNEDIRPSEQERAREGESILGNVMRTLFGEEGEDRSDTGAPPEPSPSQEESQPVPEQSPGDPDAPTQEEGSVYRLRLENVDGRLEAERAAAPGEDVSPRADVPSAETAGPEAVRPEPVRWSEPLPERPDEPAAAEHSAPQEPVLEPPAWQAPAEETATEEPAARPPAPEEPAFEPPPEPTQQDPAFESPAAREGTDRGGSAPATGFDDPEPEGRIAALRELLADPARAPVADVAARLRDPNPRVRETAVAVLAAHGDPASLVRALDVRYDLVDGVRRAVAAAMHDRRSHELVRALHDQLDTDERCRPAAVTLAELGEVELLLQAMLNVHPERRVVIREALDEADVTRRLIDDLTDDNVERRRTAVDRLGRMRATRAVEAVAGRLQDPEPHIRIAAAEALARIGHQAAGEPLKRALVNDPDVSVAVAVANALRSLDGRPTA